MNSTDAFLKSSAARFLLMVVFAFATVGELSGQLVCEGSGPDYIEATAGSDGRCILVNGSGQTHAKSPRIQNPWAPSDAADGYLASEVSLSTDGFSLEMSASAAGKSGRIPLAFGNAFITPRGSATAYALASPRRVVVRFPELTTIQDCVAEVTYEATFRANARGVNGGALSAVSSFSVGLIPPFQFGGTGVVHAVAGSISPDSNPPLYYFYDTVPRGGTNGVQIVRFRAPLKTNAVGEAFATYELSGQIKAEVSVPGGSATHNTDVSASVRCDMHYAGAEIICTNQSGEQRISTAVFGLLPVLPRLEFCSTNGESVICCRTNFGFPYCRTNDPASTNDFVVVNLTRPFWPASEEMSAEPADAAVSIGERVDLAFSAALRVALSNDPPARVQWFRSGAPAQPIVGETNATLTFLRAAPGDSGAYYAVLTDDSASVTSRVATLTVSPLRPDLRLQLMDGRRRVTVGGDLGRAYRIEYAEDPSSTNWNTLVNLTLDLSPFTYEDTNALAPRKFYRAVMLP